MTTRPQGRRSTLRVFTPRIAAILFLQAVACQLSHAADGELPRVRLAWEPSPGVDVAGYRVYYGTATFSYTNFVEVTNSLISGHVTNAVVSDLLPGGKYYFAATAFDSYHQESDFSNEVTFETRADITPAPSVTLQPGVMNLQNPGNVTFITRVQLPGHYIKGVQVLANDSVLREYNPGGSARGMFSYKVVWNDIAAGNYSVRARVLYDFAGVADSEPLTFQVTGSAPEEPLLPSDSTVAKSVAAPAVPDGGLDSGSAVNPSWDGLEPLMTRWVTSGPPYAPELLPLFSGLTMTDSPTAKELTRHLVYRYLPRFSKEVRHAIQSLPPGPRRNELLGLAEELAPISRTFTGVIRYHPDLERVLMLDAVRHWYLLEPSRVSSWAMSLPAGLSRENILRALAHWAVNPAREPL